MLMAAVKRIRSAVWVAFSSPQYSVWGLQPFVSSASVRRMHLHCHALQGPSVSPFGSNAVQFSQLTDMKAHSPNAEALWVQACGAISNLQEAAGLQPGTDGTDLHA